MDYIKNCIFLLKLSREQKDTDWKNIFAYHVSDKDLCPKHIRNSQNILLKQPLRMGKRLEQTPFTKKYMHMKRCLTPLVIREIQIKNTVRLHYLPFRMAKIKTTDHYQCWCGYGAAKSLIHCWWGHKGSHYVTQLHHFLSRLAYAYKMTVYSVSMNLSKRNRQVSIQSLAYKCAWQFYLETNQIFINRWMEKHTGILFSNKKEQPVNVTTWMNLEIYKPTKRSSDLDCGDGFIGTPSYHIWERYQWGMKLENQFYNAMNTVL